MTSYFTIDELCYSDVAKAKGIDNTPSKQVRKNLQELINFLNPLRESWGSPILISSGYRCEELNTAVGGSETSVHVLGWAADLVPQNGELENFKQFVIDYLKDKDFDQYIDEAVGDSSWAHIGLYYTDSESQRKQFLKYRNGTYSYID